VYGVVEVPLPKLRDNDVLIKVKACGVCGTDLHTHEGEFIAKVWEASYILRALGLSTFRLADLIFLTSGWLPSTG
jgi:threonine dehydrogenase-like Zn-dependent dehydrogenase